jgi:hypothetical protein
MDLSDAQKATIEKARKAVKFADNGDPAKDAIDDDEVLDALRLLVQIIDDGRAEHE